MVYVINTFKYISKERKNWAVAIFFFYSVILLIVNFQKPSYIASFEFYPQKGKCLL